MKEPAELILEWKQAGEAAPRDTLYRALVEFEKWVPPVAEAYEERSPFEPFIEELLPARTQEGRRVRALCTCYDASDIYREKFGPTAFSDYRGQDIFGLEWKATDALCLDPGTPQELVIDAEDFPKLKALAEAVAVERAWQRLRKGTEQPGDLALVAHYGSYHLGVAKRGEENFCFCEVVNDDERAFIALFTHADAITLGWPEIAERYAGLPSNQATVSGPQIFPTLANEPTAGFVINYHGPSEPAVFTREVFDLLVEEINKPGPEAPAPEPTTPPPIPSGPPPLPATAVADQAVVDEVAKLSNEGVRLTQTRNADTAEDLLRRALALAEEKLGADHPSTAACLNNFGDFLRQNGRFEEARDVLGRAVVAEDRAHGPDSFHTGTALNNLALTLRRLERFDEAEPLYRRVLAIFEREHGPESINVAGVLNNYSQVLQRTGRSAEAEPHMRRVIALFEKHFGQNHPNVAIALNNLARLFESTGRAVEAEPLSRRHLRIFQIFEDETGNEHAHKSSAIQGYGDLLTGLGWSADDLRDRIGAILRGSEVSDLGQENTMPSAEADIAPDFNRLSATATDAGASMIDNDALFGAAFRLKEWYFLARGELPNLRPYVAANPTIVDGAPMVKAFTDTKRLHAFAKENGLTGPDGEVQILALPVATILPTMASYADNGVTHIHFNADLDSHGFYIPLVQLPIIRAHLEKHRLL